MSELKALWGMLTYFEEHNFWGKRHSPYFNHCLQYRAKFAGARPTYGPSRIDMNNHFVSRVALITKKDPNRPYNHLIYIFQTILSNYFTDFTRTYKLRSFIIIVVTIHFLKRLYFPRQARVRRLPYAWSHQVPPHISEHCPFRLQPKQFHAAFHTYTHPWSRSMNQCTVCNAHHLF